MLWLKYLIKALVLPPAGPILLALAGIVVGLRHPKWGRRIAATGVVLLLLLAMPAVARFLVRSLDTTPAFDPAHAGNAQAIVILSGGLRTHAPEYGGTTLGKLTLERVRYGARLARETGLPVLVSGGRVRHGPVEAVLMRDALMQEFNVPVRWVEVRSRNTHENAQNSAAILKAAAVQRVILVGHSFDFPRSRREFEAAGMQVVAAPIGIPRGPTDVDDFLPTAGGLQLSYYALYEILANALYRVTHAGAPDTDHAPLPPASVSTAR